MTGSKERKQNLDGLDIAMQHMARDAKHGFDSVLQCIGHAIAVVVSVATLVIDLLKAIANGIAWAGSGIVGATKDLMHEHSTMIREAE